MTKNDAVTPSSDRMSRRDSVLLCVWEREVRCKAGAGGGWLQGGFVHCSGSIVKGEGIVGIVDALDDHATRLARAAVLWAAVTGLSLMIRRVKR